MSGQFVVTFARAGTGRAAVAAGLGSAPVRGRR